MKQKSGPDKAPAEQVLKDIRRQTRRQYSDRSGVNVWTTSLSLGEMHLRRVLKSYSDYYNRVRTHRSLNKDAPVSRPVQRTGVISSRAILGGLHHRYARA